MDFIASLFFGIGSFLLFLTAYKFIPAWSNYWNIKLDKDIELQHKKFRAFEQALKDGKKVEW